MTKRIRNFVLSFLIAIQVLSPISSFAFSLNESKYFSDMNNCSWAIEAVDTMYEYGIINGVVNPTETTKGIFNPKAIITKAELLVMLNKLIPNDVEINPLYPSAADIQFEKWYTESALYLTSIGIAETDHFNNNSYTDYYVSREECFYSLAHFVNIVFGAPIVETNLTIQFIDYKYISPRYVSAVSTLTQLNIINGNAGNLNPKSFITRAEVAQCFYKVLTLYQDNYSKIEYITPFDLNKEAELYLQNHITEKEINLIAWMIGGTGRNGGAYPNEIGYGHAAEKAAVAWEILNRVDSTGYGMGGSVTYVISFPGQYGNYYYSYSYDKVCEETYQIVRTVCLIWAKEHITGEYNAERVIPPGYRWHKGNGQHNSFYKSYEDFCAGRNALRWYDGYFA